METLIIIALVVLSPCAYFAGFRRGQALGWLDHYFSTVANDRARRDRIGRFRHVTKP